MNLQLKTAAAAMVAISLLSASGYAQEPAPAAKKHTAAKKAKTPPPPTVEEQIKTLRDELEGQINGLKSDLATKDEQLKQAQQAAADAQSAAAKAQAAASAQQQEVTDNATAVTTLQSTVTDLKGNQASLATTVSDETSKVKKALENPTALHYKGINITPGGYIAGETIFRTHATGGDIATAWSSLPYESSDNVLLSEFYGSGRATRLSLLTEGKLSWGTLRGYAEGDFLGVGAGSNNVQSNSYDFRQRVLYAEAKTNTGWTFAGGQLWSLLTEGKKGISSSPADNAGPQTIDPNNTVGFIWARQYGFRVVKSMDKVAVGISVENPQLQYTASIAGNTPYSVLGSVGNSSGNYNSTISGCTPSLQIVNYTNQAVTDTVTGATVNTPVPVTKLFNSCANVTNISFNQAPDVLIKFAVDPGWGHYEVFGVAGFAHQTVYPGVTANSYLYGGYTDIKTGLTVAPALTTAGYYNNSLTLGGVGGSLRVPVIKDKFSLGAKGFFGPGVGRYGQSNLADVTTDASGNLKAIHNVSGLITAEATPTPRLNIYLYYGGDYAGREDYSQQVGINGTPSTLGAPKAALGTDGGTLAQAIYGGTWGPPKAAAAGYGSRLLNNSSCPTLANPSYGDAGYFPGGSCGAQTRDVQEITAGYWYDIYKGDRGRLRQGIQYGYAVREGWSGAPVAPGVVGIGAKGIDNMFWTSLRYYLP